MLYPASALNPEVGLLALFGFLDVLLLLGSSIALL